jgi:hypothetical protein
MTTRFGLGRLLTTPGALEALQRNEQNPLAFVGLHAAGDWGELDAHDRSQNAYAIGRQLRIMSSYLLKDGTKLWIITEADRSATTLLLPEEY